MSEFREVFKKVNGQIILKEYAKSHVLCYALLTTMMEGLSKKSLELVRESVYNKIVKRLRKKYMPLVYSLKKEIEEKPQPPCERSNKVWICWLQGLEDAPQIVKICYNSILKYLGDREIVLITSQNYKEWITLPEFIEKKYNSGKISHTHFSDLIRLELLEHYGGTWIDATILCTSSNIPEYIINSDFFMYQIMKPGLDGHPQRTSNWFITSCSHHPFIVLLKQLLYKYWKKNDRVVDYFIFHDFMELIIEAYPEEWLKVVPVSSSIPHILLLRLSEQFNETVWEAAKEMTPFHKLSWKFSETQMYTMNRPNTFYSVVLKSLYDKDS